MQLPPDFCGIYNSDPRSVLAPLCLPLENVAVHANIVDGAHISHCPASSLTLRLSNAVSAIVTITQKFWQYLSTPVHHANYVFPVPSRAAVCGFEMRTQDGRVVKAIAKEKEQARHEYNAAVSAGKMAGLVEHVTDDGSLLFHL